MASIIKPPPLYALTEEVFKELILAINFFIPPWLNQCIIPFYKFMYPYTLQISFLASLLL